MEIRYGDITLGFAKCEAQRQSIYTDDQTSYLYTEWLLNVSAVISGNQFALAYRKPTPDEAAGGFRAVSFPDANPGSTDNAIRHYMMTPRRQLTVKEGDTVLVQCPTPLTPGQKAPPILADVAGTGPLPISFHIQEILGVDKTFFVNWQVKFCTNECKDATGIDPHPILASRWVLEQEIDADYFQVWRTSGTVIVRMDLFDKYPFNPDSLRNFIFAAIPFGFQRRSIQVTGHPTGDGFDYSYEDYQTVNQFVRGQVSGVAAISAIHRQSITANPEVFSGAMQAMERTINWRFSVANTPGDEKPKPRRRRKTPLKAPTENTPNN
jgi:hypothetical protein